MVRRGLTGEELWAWIWRRGPLDLIDVPVCLARDLSLPSRLSPPFLLLPSSCLLCSAHRCTCNDGLPPRCINTPRRAAPSIRDDKQMRGVVTDAEAGRMRCKTLADVCCPLVQTKQQQRRGMTAGWRVCSGCVCVVLPVV